jgi:hypothetical protein
MAISEYNVTCLLKTLIRETLKRAKRTKNSATACIQGGTKQAHCHMSAMKYRR